jgi:hypothetical protein
MNEFMWGLSPSSRTFLEKNACYLSKKRLENVQVLNLKSASGFDFLKELCEKVRIDLELGRFMKLQKLTLIISSVSQMLEVATQVMSLHKNIREKILIDGIIIQ